MFAQKLVYAPNEVLDKDIENDTIGDTRSEVSVENDSNRVRNAFDILMDSGGGHTIKTPGKGIKRLQKRTVREKGFGKRNQINFFFFNFSIFRS